LRPNAFSEREIREWKKGKVPGFQILQQQNAGKAKFRPLKDKYLLRFHPLSLRPAGVILSIDPGQGSNSYSVIQAWTMVNKRYVLLDQWRGRAPYHQFYYESMRLIRRYRPGVVLVENNSHGAALLDEIPDRDGMLVVRIEPRESKLKRTQRLFAQIRKFNVMIPEDAAWVTDFVEEFTTYPSRLSDQIDAASQAVDYMQRKGCPAPVPSAAPAALVTGSQVNGQQPIGLRSDPIVQTTSVPGAALALARFVRRRH
jgi:predicted phage terminase large subunit-like protein